MSNCEHCELKEQGLCPGIQGGAFCTELTGSADQAFHPANTDPQNAGISCETSFFYEKLALELSRNPRRLTKDDAFLLELLLNLTFLEV